MHVGVERNGYKYTTHRRRLCSQQKVRPKCQRPIWPPALHLRIHLFPIPTINPAPQMRHLPPNVVNATDSQRAHPLLPKQAASEAINVTSLQRTPPMASGGAAVQTFVLRVSIHCHGCKKKVRKVLRNIEGVHDVKVDATAHKVIVTGTVDAETLVKRLQKSGKQALPWQYPPAAPAKSPEEAPPAPEEAPPAGDGGKDSDAAASAEDDNKKPEEPAKGAQTESSEKKPEQEAAAAEEKKADGDAEKETESEKKAETEEAKASDEEAKEEAGESEAAELAKEAGNDEATEKKSKPKETAAAAATVDRSLSTPPPVPKQGQYEGYNSPPYYAPQPVMSYHMAQPRASESHYAPLPEQGYSMHQQPPPPAYSSSSSMQQQYAYSQQPQPMQQWSPSYLYMPHPHASPESYYHDYYSPPGTHAPPPPLQDSYRLFDDENPNSCSVM